MSTNTNTNGASDGEQQRTQELLDGFMRHGGSRRFGAPAQLPGATAFSQQGKIRGTRWLFETIERLPWVEQALAEVEINRNWGRRRAPGRWAWMFLDFTTSDSVDVQPWYDNTDVAIWQLAGFTHKPSYPTVYERFVELEERWPQYEAAAALLIQHAVSREPQIGTYVHIDSTEAETHAAFVHDCQPSDGCEWAARDRARNARRDRRRRGLDELVDGEQPPEQLSLTELDALVSNVRHVHTDAETAPEPPAPGKPAARPDRVPSLVPRADRQAKAEVEPVEGADYGHAQEVVVGSDFLRVKVNGHWYRSLDPTAGVRAYKGKKGTTVRFWHGFYNTKFTDHYTGGALVVGLFSASRQEFDCYEDMLDRLEGVLGKRPRAVVADRGYSVVKVFRLNTMRGIASVFPWRKNSAREKRIDGYLIDRHGVPRCKHCGAPTEFVRFAHEPQPRVWFTCLGQGTAACTGAQSLACSHNWRLLLPLWRNDPVYMELRATHGEYEAIQDYWRDRYKVGPDSLGQRPKRRGSDWQQLRASAALVVEWLRICSREGWLGEERSNHKQPHARMEKGTRAAINLREFRTRIGLNAPYGPKAVAVYGVRRYRHTPHERWALRLAWKQRCKARKAEAKREARAA